MVGLSSAVQWWEEWQMPILVLCSMVVQWLLFPCFSVRKLDKFSRLRHLIWLAYLGSDALAIYALATLFNRRGKRLEDGSRVLEVVWAPVLLMHLGGQDTITAYNIEDNELWRRHVLTAVSQITVAIYVFCKSWPGGDNRLLQAAILMFVPGVLKCLEKPFALKSASITSVISSQPAQRMAYKQGSSLDDFVARARAFVKDGDHPTPQDHKEGEINSTQDHAQPYEPSKLFLFVDRASPYPVRLKILKRFWALDEELAYRALQSQLSIVFSLLYMKKGVNSIHGTKYGEKGTTWDAMLGMIIRNVCLVLPWAAIGLFHYSHKEAYNGVDVKITYALFCCTATLECYSINANVATGGVDREEADVARDKPQPPLASSWPGLVWQRSFMRTFARNKKHAKMMRVADFFGGREYWCGMKPCPSSSSCRITELVLRHVKAGWKDYICDAAHYNKFNDDRGQWTLERTKCSSRVWQSLNQPFDESVLLWHISTDLCFYYMDAPTDHRCSTPPECGEFSGDKCSACCKTSPSHARAVTCREMSNYMMYLLTTQPEMLLPGTRPNLLAVAYDELNGILKDEKPPVDERGLTQRIITELRSAEGSQEEEEGGGGGRFIHDAWAVAKELLDLGDEKMWEVMEGVWVEMLCFSAARCRGYLHAKALGTGGELLTYVWLLLSNMGMETLSERLQRRELPSGEENNATAPSTTETLVFGGEDMV